MQPYSIESQHYDIIMFLNAIFFQGNTNNRSTLEQQLEYPGFLPWLLLYDLGPGA